MKYRKIITLAVCLAMGLCCFTGCSNKDGSSENSSSSDKKDEQVMEMRDISAKELVSEMKIGWNLGNTP